MVGIWFVDIGCMFWCVVDCGGVGCGCLCGVMSGNWVCVVDVD